MPKPPEPLAAILVKETVYYRPRDGQYEELELTYTRPVTTDEQPYRRQVKVGADGTDARTFLDTGWIGEPSMIVVRNDEGGTPHVIPTPEERYVRERKIVTVWASPAGSDAPPVPVALVKPFDSFRFTPAPDTVYTLSAAFGPVRCTVAAYPS